MEREIEGFKNYFITDDGRVISKVKSKHKELCQWIDNVGYKQVILRKNKRDAIKEYIFWLLKHLLKVNQKVIIWLIILTGTN
jgi:hypothetical protein